MKRRNVCKGKSRTVATKVAMPVDQMPAPAAPRSEFETQIAACVLGNLIDQLASLRVKVDEIFEEALNLAQRRCS